LEVWQSERRGKSETLSFAGFQRLQTSGQMFSVRTTAPRKLSKMEFNGGGGLQAYMNANDTAF
jgi:hypothetical protein